MPFRLLLILALLLCACGGEPTAPDGRRDLTLADYEGDWEGVLNIAGQSLPLVMHVPADEATAVTLDSPSQGAFGIEASATALSDGALDVTWGAIGARYLGRLDDAGEVIEGQFSQGPFTVDLTFERGDGEVDPAALASSDRRARPQEPRDPLPYEVEEISLTMSDGVTLAGTLTMPRGVAEPPLAVLFSGTGAQDRDESLMGHRPFLVLSDRLTRAGIATVRFDDRGVGGSGGDYVQTRLERLADDALEVTAAMRSRGAFSDVGIIGHSEGSIYAGLAAARGSDQGPDYIVSLAGPFASLSDTIMDQVDRMQTLSGIEGEAKAANMETQQGILDAARTGDTPEEACEAVRSHTEPFGLFEQARPFCDPIFFSLLRVDVEAAYAAVDVPVLVLFAEKDRQVVPARHRPVAEAALAANDRAIIETVEGVNHLFQTAENGDVSEYVAIDETMNEAVMERVAVFILRVSSE